MNVYSQNLTALQNAGTDHAADFRGLDGELLVRTLCIYLEGLDTALFDDVHHIFHSCIADLFHVLLRAAFFDVDFHSRAHGSYTKDLSNRLQSHFFFHIHGSSYEDQTFVSSYFHTGSDLLHGAADTVYQHAFKIGLVHTLQRHFTAAHDVCLLFHSHFLFLLSIVSFRGPSSWSVDAWNPQQISVLSVRNPPVLR